MSFLAQQFSELWFALSSAIRHWSGQIARRTILARRSQTVAISSVIKCVFVTRTDPHREERQEESGVARQRSRVAIRLRTPRLEGTRHLSSKRFTNELVPAIRARRMHVFSAATTRTSTCRSSTTSFPRRRDSMRRVASAMLQRSQVQRRDGSQRGSAPPLRPLRPRSVGADRSAAGSSARDTARPRARRRVTGRL